MHTIYDITNLPVFPDQTVVFAMDTHILLWTFYSRCAITKAYQKTAYPEFIKNVISHGNRLIVTTLNINEMLHFIEKNECDIYNNLKGTNLSVKKFRQLPAQRSMVQHEITLILKQLSSIPGIAIEPATISPGMVEAFADGYSSHRCDFFDYYLLDFCKRSGVAVISDDVDFYYSYSPIDLFTANAQILRMASE